MSAAHTLGPWHVGNGDIYADGGRADDFDDVVICAIGQSGGFRSHEYSIVKAHKPEGKANAALIAAAPDLLAFAEMMLDESDYKHQRDAARAVIAKATGNA